MVKPSLPHHGPSIVGTTVPIVPPSQSMVLLTSADRASDCSRFYLTRKNNIVGVLDGLSGKVRQTDVHHRHVHACRLWLAALWQLGAIAGERPLAGNYPKDASAPADC